MRAWRGRLKGHDLDTLSRTRRSANMAAIRSKDMKPERMVRSIAHHLGYRFRLHRTDLPGKPDLVFPSKGCVIFVNGCFWHQHNKGSCLDGRLPKSRQEYWAPKLLGNVERDVANRRALRRLGWRVLTIWECDTYNLGKVTAQLSRFLA